MFARPLLTVAPAVLAGLFLAATAVAAPDPAARYEADRKLCAEERDSGMRMQCLRDARAEYDKAVGAGGQATSGQATSGQATSGQATSGQATGGQAQSCAGCGRVVAVMRTERKGDRTGAGVVAGGVAGGVIGHQIGGGHGRTLATVAGALGGAFVGDKVEQNMRTNTIWSVRVRLDDGAERTFDYENDPGLREGDAIVVSSGTLMRRQ